MVGIRGTRTESGVVHPGAGSYTIEHRFVGSGVRYLRRSSCCAGPSPSPPGDLAIEREEALRLLQELASIRAELDRLKQGLRELVAGIEALAVTGVGLVDEASAALQEGPP